MKNMKAHMKRMKILSGANDRKTTKPNKFEQKIYKLLDDANIKYEREYRIEGTIKFFDAYLPEYNILLEFDGIYYHKLTYEDCIYPMQKRNFKNDKNKNKIVYLAGYTLLRIREDNIPKDIKLFIKNKH